MFLCRFQLQRVPRSLPRHLQFALSSSSQWNQVAVATGPLNRSPAAIKSYLKSLLSYSNTEDKALDTKLLLRDVLKLKDPALTSAIVQKYVTVSNVSQRELTLALQCYTEVRDARSAYRLFTQAEMVPTSPDNSSLVGPIPLIVLLKALRYSAPMARKGISLYVSACADDQRYPKLRSDLSVACAVFALFNTLGRGIGEKELSWAMEVKAMLEKYGTKLDARNYGELVLLAGKCGNFVQAKALFDEAREVNSVRASSGREKNDYLLNCLLRAAATCNEHNTVISIYQLMLKSGGSPGFTQFSKNVSSTDCGRTDSADGDKSGIFAGTIGSEDLGLGLSATALSSLVEACAHSGSSMHQRMALDELEKVLARESRLTWKLGRSILMLLNNSNMIEVLEQIVHNETVVDFTGLVSSISNRTVGGRQRQANVRTGSAPQKQQGQSRPNTLSTEGDEGEAEDSAVASSTVPTTASSAAHKTATAAATIKSVDMQRQARVLLRLNHAVEERMRITRVTTSSIRPDEQVPRDLLLAVAPVFAIKCQLDMVYEHLERFEGVYGPEFPVEVALHVARTLAKLQLWRELVSLSNRMKSFHPFEATLALMEGSSKGPGEASQPAPDMSGLVDANFKVEIWDEGTLSQVGIGRLLEVHSMCFALLQCSGQLEWAAAHSRSAMLPLVHLASVQGTMPCAAESVVRGIVNATASSVNAAGGAAAGGATGLVGERAQDIFEVLLRSVSDWPASPATSAFLAEIAHAQQQRS